MQDRVRYLHERLQGQVTPPGWQNTSANQASRRCSGDLQRSGSAVICDLKACSGEVDTGSPIRTCAKQGSTAVSGRGSYQMRFDSTGNGCSALSLGRSENVYCRAAPSFCGMNATGPRPRFEVSLFSLLAGKLCMQIHKRSISKYRR
jgi:hypothetical protein